MITWPAAGRASLAERLEQTLSDPLAGHLHQTQRRHLGDLMLGPVPSQALDETPMNQVTVALENHVDEVDDDNAADVAQSQLADDLLGGLEIVAGNCLLEVSAGTDEFPGVHVDDGHRLGAVDDERTPRRKEDLSAQGFASCSSTRNMEEVAVASVLADSIAQVRRHISAT
jgi:hypothetical protein